jgi:predicted SAM-dependent methyltransferase
MSYWIRPVLACYLKGNRFTDPIDQQSFRKFLPYGYGKQRQNVLAPGTLSLERHRLLWLYLTKETDCFTSSKKVLHIAPEQCFLSRFKKQGRWDYTTADLHSPIADVKADICKLPFQDNQFDLVLCNHVLEHIEDDKQAMRELYRVLRPGGLGIFQVPQDLLRTNTYEDPTIKSAKERAKHFGQYDHVRIYGRDYFDRLRSVGFEVSELDYTKDMAAEQLRRYCLSKGEILPVCTKK